MKPILLLAFITGCDYFDSPYEKAQKTIDLCQPYRRTIKELEDKIYLLESENSDLKRDISDLESNQY